MSTATLKKVAILLVLAALAILFFKQGWHQQLTFENLKAKQADLSAFTAENKPTMMLGFFLAYVAAAALSLPGATILTLAGGALFGLGLGIVLVSFASTLGATLAMLVSRYFFRDAVQDRFGKKLRAFNDGLEREGGFYLFTLRLIPIFPFFVINLGMGLTKIRTWTFYWVSQLGMLLGTAVYVNAGTQLAQIESPAGILSPGLIGAFALLGVMPLAARKMLNVLKAKRIYKGHDKPKTFDYNIVAIGGGSAGLVTSYIAAAVKAKVALIEREAMGGDCLNTGCVPSKALIRSAKMLHNAKRAGDWGFQSTDVTFDFADVMDRVHGVIKTIEPHDSVERYEGLGVDCIQGEATIVDPWRVKVGNRVITARNIVVATGAGPLVPPIPGLDQVSPLTSDNLWQLRELPKRMVVLGGGPIGSEMTQAFARLGAEVTQVEMLPRILSREDPEIAELVKDHFEAEGVRVLTGHKATRFGVDDGQRYMMAETADGDEVRLDFDEVLVALGRRPRTRGFGLEELGVEIARNGTIVNDDFLRTNFPNIYVCGDVAGPYQFTHTAAHQAWYAAVNALFSPFKSFRADYRVIPWATFTDPEVARVGLNELEAKEQEIEYDVTTYGIDDLDRAIADGEARGLVKVLTIPGKDKILGVTIAGAHAGDLLAEYVLAMKHGLGLNKILGTIHTYPTMAEANKYVAGNWKKANKPEGLLAAVERFHDWRRGHGLPGVVKLAMAGLVLLTLAGAGLFVTRVLNADDTVSTESAAPSDETQPPEETSAMSNTSSLRAAADSPDANGSDDAAPLLGRVLSHVDDRGQVDYAALAQNPDDLRGYLDYLASLDRAEFDEWSDEEQIALLSNAYNAITLQSIVDALPLSRSFNLGSMAHPRGIRWISGVWDKTTWPLMGEDVTLDHIEHGVLRKDYDEPRLHAALVCAAKSCPPLRNTPFTGAALDEQFDDQMRRFVTNPAIGIAIDRKANTVGLSKIFDWYGEDFVGQHLPSSGFGAHDDKVRAVLAASAPFLDADDQAFLRRGNFSVDYLGYDWSLNEQ